MGGGVSHYSYPAGTSPVVVLASTSAGLVVNLVTGTAMIPLIHLLRRRPLAAFFLTIFAGRSVLGALSYLSLGLYYGVGDPGHLAVALSASAAAPWETLWPWILPLAGLPPASYAMTRLYAAQQERWLPSRGPGSRLVYAAATLGVAVAIVFGAPRVLNERLTVSYDGRRLAAERLHAQRVGEATRAHRQRHPHATERELQQAARAVARPSPGEVDAPFPLIPLLALLAGLGAVVALVRTPRPGSSLVPVSVACAGVMIVIALIVLSILAVAPIWRCR